MTHHPFGLAALTARQVLIAGALGLAVLAAPVTARAQSPTIVGALTNFDVLNRTGEHSLGFEIELEGLQVSDIQYAFGEAGPGGVCYIRYCSPTITQGVGRVFVRWMAGWDPATQQFTTRFNVPGMAVTPDTPPANPSLFVTGHQCWSLGQGAQYPTSGCEHFGVVTLHNPTQTFYRWLVADPLHPGALIPFGGTASIPALVPIPSPVAIVANGGGVPDVDVAIQAPAPAAPDHRYGKAQWVKVYKKEIARHADLDELVGGHPNDVVPNEQNGAAETEWKLLQLDTKNPDKGSSQLVSHGGSHSHAVVRRYEFFKYTGPVVAPGGTSGGGKGGGAVLSTDDQEQSTCPRDPVTHDCLSPGDGEVGEFIGSQMAAQNLDQAGELSQSIVFAPLADRVIGDAPIALSATGGASGLPVTFSTAGACAVDPIDGTTLTLTGVGGCVVMASQAGDAVYAPAADVLRSFLINKGSQAIAFGALPDGHRFGDLPFDVSATGGASGNPVTFTGSGACSTTGATVTIAGVGVCMVTASQAGNDSYDAAADVARTTTIAKGVATVSFAAGTLAQTYDGAVKTVATTTSPAALVVNLAFTGTPQGAGSYPVSATIDDTNYEGSASDILIIAKAAQAITFAPIADRTFGDAPFDVSATGGASGNAVAFAAAGACTIGGNTVTLTGAGNCTITASQAGDANYDAAADVSRTFQIASPPPPPTTNPLVNPGPVSNREGDEVELRLRVTDVADPRARHEGDDNDHNDSSQRPRGLFSAANLPAGLALEKEHGVIRGHVRKGSAGVYAVTITFTAGGRSFSQQFTWTILPASARSGHDTEEHDRDR